jgi:hypothetical protein
MVFWYHDESEHQYWTAAVQNLLHSPLAARGGLMTVGLGGLRDPYVGAPRADLILTKYDPLARRFDSLVQAYLYSRQFVFADLNGQYRKQIKALSNLDHESYQKHMSNLTCPHCQTTLTSWPHPGTTHRCPNCQTVFFFEPPKPKPDVDLSGIKEAAVCLTRGNRKVVLFLTGSGCAFRVYDFTRTPTRDYWVGSSGVVGCQQDPNDIVSVVREFSLRGHAAAVFRSCEEAGFGATMQFVSDLWRELYGTGALTVGPTVSTHADNQAELKFAISKLRQGWPDVSGALSNLDRIHL